MLYKQKVEPATLVLLEQLTQVPSLVQTRLVGGTALALQYGHRQSVDLDFVGKVQANTEEILDEISQFGKITISTDRKNIKILKINNIKVDIVNYEYDWIDNPTAEENLKLASPKDIAVLKVNAIEGRGTKKDFIDFYFLLQHYTLKEILSFYKQKYPNYSYFRALLSLSYFEDAEGEMIPKMFIPTPWEEIKDEIINKVKHYQGQQ